MEISNLPSRLFNVMVIKMLTKLRRRMEKHSENFHKDIEKRKEPIEKNQSKLKNTITETKNTLEGIKSRLNDVEERISHLEDKVVETTQSKQQKEKRILKNEDSLRNFWHICIIGVPEGKER